MNHSHPSPHRSLWKIIFLSFPEARLRAGWRLVIQTLLFLLFNLALSIPALFIPALNPVSGSPFAVLIGGLSELITITLSVYLSRRFLDRRSFTSLGLSVNRRASTDIIAGIAITFVIMGAMYLTMKALGWIQFEGFAWQTQSAAGISKNSLVILLGFILVGWNEELLSRGYHLQTIASGTNLFWGLVLSSSVFGILHLLNPNASWIVAAGIFFIGLFLATGYLRTGQLWLSIGLHIGWNFFEGAVFGFPVSGLAIYPLMHIHVTGPKLWTGGAFGPEAGLIVLPTLALGVVLVFLYTRLRGTKPPKI